MVDLLTTYGFLIIIVGIAVFLTKAKKPFLGMFIACLSFGWGTILLLRSPTIEMIFTEGVWELKSHNFFAKDFLGSIIYFLGGFLIFNWNLIYYFTVKMVKLDRDNQDIEKPRKPGRKGGH